MEVKYDKANDLFTVGGKQLYWSSVYVLRQKKTDLKTLLRRLKVSKEEQPMFLEELDDLRELGFIRGKNKIASTKRGMEFLREVEHKVKFKNLREISIHDIDDAFEEAERVFRLDIGKTKSLIRKMPFRHERVDWFPLFLNSFMGYFAFLLAMFATLLAIGTITAEEFIVQLAMLPIVSILSMGVAVLFLWLMYHAGKGISLYIFRRK